MKVRPPLPPIPPLRIGAMAQGAPIGQSGIGAAMAQHWRIGAGGERIGGETVPPCLSGSLKKRARAGLYAVEGGMELDRRHRRNVWRIVPEGG